MANVRARLSPGLTTETVDTVEGLTRLLPQWWALWDRCPSATPFQSPAWLLPWWRAFQPGGLLVGHLPWGVPYWAASDGEVPHVTASERSAAPLERRREESARTTEPLAECTGSPGCPCPSLTGCG